MNHAAAEMAVDTPVSARNPLRPFLAGAAVTTMIFAVLLFLASRAGVLSEFSVFTADEERPVLIPSEDVLPMRGALVEIRSLVDMAKLKIETNPGAIKLPNTDKFHHINLIFPDEYKKLSVIARSGMGFLVRVDGSDYKILLDGKICTIANHDKVFQIDPVREQSTGTLCRYFSVWKGAGERF